MKSINNNYRYVISHDCKTKLSQDQRRFAEDSFIMIMKGQMVSYGTLLYLFLDTIQIMNIQKKRHILVQYSYYPGYMKSQGNFFLIHT